MFEYLLGDWGRSLKHLMSVQQKSNRIIGTKVEKFDDTADKNCSSDLSPSPTPTPFTPQHLHQASNFNFFFPRSSCFKAGKRLRLVVIQLSSADTQRQAQFRGNWPTLHTNTHLGYLLLLEERSRHN